MFLLHQGTFLFCLFLLSMSVVGPLENIKKNYLVTRLPPNGEPHQTEIVKSSTVSPQT